MTTRGLLHSEIDGSSVARTSPSRFAACCVLHRHMAPRHPPPAVFRPLPLTALAPHEHGPAPCQAPPKGPEARITAPPPPRRVRGLACLRGAPAFSCSTLSARHLTRSAGVMHSVSLCDSISLSLCLSLSVSLHSHTTSITLRRSTRAPAREAFTTLHQHSIFNW